MTRLRQNVLLVTRYFLLVTRDFLLVTCYFLLVDVDLIVFRLDFQIMIMSKIKECNNRITDLMKSYCADFLLSLVFFLLFFFLTYFESINDRMIL